MRLKTALALLRAFLAAVLVSLSLPAFADDGYDLWLRYRAVSPEWQARYAPAVRAIALESTSPTLDAARSELTRGISGLVGTAPAANASAGDGAIMLGTPAGSPAIRQLRLNLSGLGPEGYLITSARIDGQPRTVIAANTDLGVLYGAFRFLQLIQTQQPTEKLNLRSAPKMKLRVLNHWDNLDRSVERGYAGQSIWDWWKLPDFKDQRYTDYARANASIGINGTVLNNVNASSTSLTAPYIAKAAALADVFRPYGMKVYLSARFSAPIEIGGLKTADPLDPAVRAWWKAKAEEIYTAIPNFGGFLVKANSEGQPGPQDYKRSHADGANMLAEAVKPHGGIVMWRAFVYAPENNEDRVKQAYSEFKPLDGKFANNVLVQVKNGPLDFQPREPFHPLFGAMPKTPLMMEFQITKEYLGFATHLVYLGTMWEEVLDADTHAKGKGSTVAKVIDGSLQGYPITGIAGVANVGSDRNWSGSHFDQANWFAFGRFAWDPSLSARGIAEDWTRMTWGNAPALVGPVVDLMMGSREAAVNYMTPLGLAHLMGTGHHYGPAPWVSELSRPEWNPVYYHRADKNGIGVDRTKSGTDALSQFFPPVAHRFADLRTVPEEYLLWFHHVGWDYRMNSGRPLWTELVARYSLGVDQVKAMREKWATLSPYVDPARFEQTASFLQTQEKEAQWWRDASIAYFSEISGRPVPVGFAPPAHDLGYYKSLRFDFAPGQNRQEPSTR